MNEIIGSGIYGQDISEKLENKIIISINGVDYSEQIIWNSLNIEDNITDMSSSASFKIKQYGTKDFLASVGDEIYIYYNFDLIFNGRLVTINTSGSDFILEHNITAKDNTYILDQFLVNEKYNDTTVENIIRNIVSDFIKNPNVTTNNVFANIPIKTITFNSLPASKCLQILAEQINYSWYIDCNKDIHFVAKYEEDSPFNITDAERNYYRDSLSISDDISQLKNKIVVRGGEKQADIARTVNETGDGNKKTFSTNFKFAVLPTVYVNSVQQTVGLDNLNSEDDYDCLWNYNEKYIKFKNTPTSGQIITFTGYPLIPIIVEHQDDDSVALYGIQEFKVENKTIRSSEEASQFALSQLEAYADSMVNGRFTTKRYGLRSGQVIVINLSAWGINETYSIQRVTMSMKNKFEGIWSVEVANTKTLGIIVFLQNLLLKDARNIEINQDELVEKYFKKSDIIDVKEIITKDPFGEDTPPEFVLGDFVITDITDPARLGLLDISFIVY